MNACSTFAGAFGPKKQAPIKAVWSCFPYHDVPDMHDTAHGPRALASQTLVCVAILLRAPRRELIPSAYARRSSKTAGRSHCCHHRRGVERRSLLVLPEPPTQEGSWHAGSDTYLAVCLHNKGVGVKAVPAARSARTHRLMSVGALATPAFSRSLLAACSLQSTCALDRICARDAHTSSSQRAAASTTAGQSPNASSPSQLKPFKWNLAKAPKRRDFYHYR